MNVLITGAWGWLGKALTEVVARQHTVTAFELESSDAPWETTEFNCRVIYGDVTNLADLREACKGQDAVIHAAAENTRSDRYAMGNPSPFLINVQGTYNLLEACRSEEIGQVIQIASAETHVDHPEGTFLTHRDPYLGLPGNVYDLTKHLQEKVCAWFARQHGMNIISLRLGDIVDLEAGLSKWDAASWHNSMRTGSWIDRYDVGLACVKALGLGLQGHQVFHLVGADSARTRFDVERTEMALDIKLTSDFDRRHASERGGDQTSEG